MQNALNIKNLNLSNSEVEFGAQTLLRREGGRAHGVVIRGREVDLTEKVGTRGTRCLGSLPLVYVVPPYNYR